jgi:hypothetical protein
MAQESCHIKASRSGSASLSAQAFAANGLIHVKHSYSRECQHILSHEDLSWLVIIAARIMRAATTAIHLDAAICDPPILWIGFTWPDSAISDHYRGN